MKKLKYYQVRHMHDRFGFNFLKEGNAEKYRDKLNKQFGVFYVVDEMQLTFKDGNLDEL